MTGVPRPFDPTLGQEAAALCPDLSTQEQALIAGAGGSSPYLMSLIKRETAWLPQALADPEAARDAEIERLGPDLTDLPQALRQAKRRVALLTALADLAGVWSLEEVTGALTALADAACEAAFGSVLRGLAERGKMPGLDANTPVSRAGLAVFAMGKMGARELNYSSDIDLIVLFDQSRFDAADYAAARAGYVQAVRKGCAMLSDLTSEGYVFRTDLRLRPDPSVTPVAMPMEAAERYYESLGRSWERAAWIKARVCAGDLEAGARFRQTLRPFVWRKHLDFAAIQDAHDMRLAIRDHKSTAGPITLAGHDMKLGRGGIREIEFFTQTRQLIAGGRDSSLRVRGTLDGLDRLAAKAWVTEAAANALKSHYRFHRTVEHRLQMLRDAQTHSLPKSQEEFERLAALMDREVPSLKEELLDRLSEVHSETEGFFAPKSTETATPDRPSPLDDTILTRWRSYPALRSARGATLFDRLRPHLEAKLAEADRPAEAVAALDGFFAGLPAGVQLFSLFDANPSLIDLLVDVASTAPALARYLAQNAQVFDAVIGGAFFAPWAGQDALEQDLTAQLDAAFDYEAQLDTARRWMKERHFRIGVHLLRGLISPLDASQQYGDLAQAVLRALWPKVQADFAKRHGAPPGEGAAIVGMGSLGSGLLSASSDLDLIIIYDAPGDAVSDGPRPLPARTYFARQTQALITSLTAATAEGKLYDVDMRLRPSGNQGPVATSWAAFQDYQMNQAWLWEHLALTRARVIDGSPKLAEQIEAFRLDCLRQSRSAAEVFAGVADMRERIFAAKAPDGPWEVKVGPGRVQDIELLAQAGLLMAGSNARDVETGLQALVALGHLAQETAQALGQAHVVQTRVQMGLRLLGIADGKTATVGSGGQTLLARMTRTPTFSDGEMTLSALQDRSAEAISTVLDA